MVRSSGNQIHRDFVVLLFFMSLRIQLISLKCINKATSTCNSYDILMATVNIPFRVSNILHLQGYFTCI